MSDPLPCRVAHAGVAVIAEQERAVAARQHPSAVRPYASGILRQPNEAMDRSTANQRHQTAGWRFRVPNEW